MSDHATKTDLKELRDHVRDDLNVYRVRLNEDIKTHMGVLYEKFAGDVGLLAEQITALNRRLITVENKVDVAIDAIGDVKVEMTGSRDQHRRLEKRVAILEAR